MLWLQEFDLEIHDKSGAKNVVADHLSRIERSVHDASLIRDDFPDESLLTLFARYYIWDDPICGKCAVIRLPGDAFRTMTLTRSLIFVIHLHLVVIRDVRKIRTHRYPRIKPVTGRKWILKIDTRYARVRVFLIPAC